MALTLALNDAEVAAITAYTERNNIDVLELFRSAVMPIIRREDDERDHRLISQAHKQTSNIIGIAEGKLTVPKEFDELDAEIIKIFDGEYDESFA